MPVPVIAAVNGVAAGAGANLALGCDIVVAARSASFIQAFAKIGLVPDCGGTWLLPRLVGRARALGLALLGDKLPAEDAERIGLIWKCVDDAAFACTRSARWRRGWRRCRRRRSPRRAPPLDAAQDARLRRRARPRGRRCSASSAASHDYLEGVAAFLAQARAGFQRPMSEMRPRRRCAEQIADAGRASTCSPPTARRAASACDRRRRPRQRDARR